MNGHPSLESVIEAGAESVTKPEGRLLFHFIFTNLWLIIIMWQLPALCYHFSIEMHNNLLPLGARLHGELAGGGTAGETVACGPCRCSRRHPQAVLKPPWPRRSTKERIQLWSDTLRHVAKPCCFKRDHSECFVCLISLSLPACLTPLSLKSATLESTKSR